LRRSAESRTGLGPSPSRPWFRASATPLLSSSSSSTCAAIGLQRTSSLLPDDWPIRSRSSLMRPSSRKPDSWRGLAQVCFAGRRILSSSSWSHPMLPSLPQPSNGRRRGKHARPSCAFLPTFSPMGDGSSRTGRFCSWKAPGAGCRARARGNVPRTGAHAHHERSAAVIKGARSHLSAVCRPPGRVASLRAWRYSDRI